MKTIEELLSTKRLEGYKGASNNHLETCLLRYNYNIEISRSFYPPLNLLEVTLRNTLHKAFSDHLNDPQWLLNYQSHLVIQSHEREKIKEAINKLSLKKRSPEEGRIIAELSFSFWVNLYDRPYIELHKAKIKSQYPNATNAQRDIVKIKNSLRDIRNLRNRIFHYEPIWHWPDLANYQSEIKYLISWMNPDLLMKSFFDSESEIGVLLQRQNIMLK